MPRRSGWVPSGERSPGDFPAETLRRPFKKATGREIAGRWLGGRLAVRPSGMIDHDMGGDSRDLL